MAIYTEESVTRVSRVTEHGILEVQREDMVLRDGEIISREYHRETLNPGDDTTGKHPIVQAVARGVWNPENVGAHSAETLAAIAAAHAERDAALAQVAAKQIELDAANAAAAAKQSQLAAKQAELDAKQNALNAAELALANKQVEIAAEIVRQIGKPA